jgi:hypothetical protein
MHPRLRQLPLVSPAEVRPRRRGRRNVLLTVVFSVSLVAAGCGSDDDNAGADSSVTEASTVIDSTVDSIGNVVDSTVDSVVNSATDDSADEGKALDIGQEIVTALTASATVGEPAMATINEVVPAIASGRAEITGLDDGDNDGKDDDAKFTVETQGGNDKACVQSQDGTWEVTDDEC